MSFQRQQRQRQSVPNSLRPFYDLYQAFKAIAKIFLLIGLGIATLVSGIQAIALPFQQTCKAFESIFKVFDVFFRRPFKRGIQNQNYGRPVQVLNATHTSKKDCKQG